MPNGTFISVMLISAAETPEKMSEFNTFKATTISATFLINVKGYHYE